MVFFAFLSNVLHHGLTIIIIGYSLLSVLLFIWHANKLVYCNTSRVRINFIMYFLIKK